MDELAALLNAGAVIVRGLRAVRRICVRSNDIVVDVCVVGQVNRQYHQLYWLRLTGSNRVKLIVALLCIIIIIVTGHSIYEYEYEYLN